MYMHMYVVAAGAGCGADMYVVEAGAGCGAAGMAARLFRQLWGWLGGDGMAASKPPIT
jgi:hypothetical protein